MRRTLSVALFILLVINVVYAQVPSISAISPLSGPVGTVVSITGSNFDTNVANNVVFFGAARANVITASQGLLTVNAPAGSNQQGITVTSNGLTAYYYKPFIVTFNSPFFTSNSLKSKVNFPASSVRAFTLKDIDDDGKTDIVAVTTDDIRVLKNNSQLNAPNFQIAYQASLDVGNNLVIEDLNGDGKQDIIVSSDWDDVHVFINSTVNGQISFIATVYPEIFSYDLIDVATADFNGDGKPDIVVGNNGFAQTIAVYTNSTIPGAPVSFLAHKVFPVQADITGVLIADIDVDGKPDVITLRYNGNAHVLRNISTLNSINFESPVAISLTPSGGLAENFLIADFNGDDKPDIGVANYDANGISFFKNNSSSGSIAFLPRQYITTGDWNLGIATGDINGDSKPDIAVTNKDNNSVSVLINTSLNTNISFDNKIDFPINGSPSSISIADIDGNGKPDVIAGSRTDKTISILLSEPQKVPSIITFPAPVQADIGPGSILNTGATSNNTETPIIYTSSNASVAIIRPDGQIEVIAPGTTIITANQPESANYLAADPVSRPYEIKQHQSITFPAMGPKLICDPDFSANASSGTPMPLFYNSSNPAVATISGTGVIHIVGTGSTTITVTQPGNNLYDAAAPQSQVLTVSTPGTPTATINANPGFACPGSSVTFTANVFDAGSTPSYEWLRNGSIIGGNSSILIVDNISASDIIQCKITPSISCGGSPIVFNKLNINLQPLVTPTVTIHVTGGQTCQGSAVSFYATPTNPGTNPSYSWYVNNKLAGMTSVPAYTYTALVNGDKVSCILMNNSAQCLTNTTALSDEVAVTIITPSVPQVSIAASANNVYAGTPITFTASTQASIANYQWRINGVNTGINTASFRTTSLKNGDEVTCAVTPNGFCVTTGVSSPIVMAILKPIGITIPNAFSPNGDGINDVWEIAGLTYYTDYVLKVFNRSGTLLFQSKGYTQAWDGLFNGKKLPTGTYYYLIDTPLSKDRRSGNVTILR